MGNKYPLLPLADLVTIHDTKRKPITKSKRISGIYPYYGASGITDYVESYVFDGLYVLLAEDGDNLRTRNTPIAFTAKGKFWVNNHAHVLKGIDDLDTQYICYALQCAEIDSYISGSTRPKITQGDLKKIPVTAPPLKIRHQIARLINDFDQKIELNKQTNQTLEQMAQTLFKSWFVDFDPVFDNALVKAEFNLENLPSTWPAALVQRATSRLQVLQHNPTLQAKLTQHNLAVTQHNTALAQTSQAENTHQHFPSEFELTDEPSIGINGWIPKGWELSNTDNEFQIKGGSTPSTTNPDFWDGGDIHWTSPKDLSGNNTKIMIDTSRKITEAGLAKITSGLLPVDTVLMSSRAPVGYLALAKVPVAINQGYIAITDAKTLSSEYTIQWLDSVMDEIKSISGGTTFAEISKKTFKSIQIIIPQKGAVDAYTQIAKANYQRITANVQEIKTLTETRDYLLPKLISGEINVCGIEHE
ncbi:restriction endonuclease subunit S [Psychromonas arctica]|uniref:restriction endonuclease subunit S n=1 Tax=Psychromonas arctica TaxID=168275 RepID=UPI00040ED9E9|nr:restriction endonuclease subunit S [Psychromonas arctica]